MAKEEKEKFKGSKEHFKYMNDYNRKTYDQFLLTVPKGKKDKLKAVAKEKGFRSLNEFINTCIDEKLKRYKIDLENM